jgi:hypothetical protein
MPGPRYGNAAKAFSSAAVGIVYPPFLGPQLGAGGNAAPVTD